MAAHPYDDGDRTLGVHLERYYGEERVCMELSHGADVAYLTSSEARAVAGDLAAHADALDELTGKSADA